MSPSFTGGTDRTTGRTDRRAWRLNAAGLFLPGRVSPRLPPGTDDFTPGPGGLYIRAVTTDEQVSPAPDRDPPSRPVRVAAVGDDAEMLRAARAQASATWLGAFVALAALAVSAIAWSGQQDVNRQQQRLNDYLILREERVYASRVAVWAVEARQESSVLSAGLDVVMQNRAPVPIRRLRITALLTTGDPRSTVRGAIDVGEMEPCQMISFRLSPPGGTTFVPAGDGWLGYSGLSVEFSEADRAWRLTGSSLTLLTGSQAPEPATAELVIPRSRASSPIGDCGEAG